MAYMYILRSEKDNKWYIGYTSLDVFERYKRHINGEVKSTKFRRPLLLAYFEYYEKDKDAAKREWHLKHPKGYQEKLEIVQSLLSNRDSWPRKGL